MTTYTVDAFGDTTPTTPAFPQPIINDILLPDGTFDTTMTTAQVFVDGTYTLQSLFLGAAVELDLGEFAGINLTGTGTITGSNDTTKLLPALVNDFGTVDINGAVYVPFTNYGQLTVSAGETLRLGGDFSGQSASAVTVAAGAELDVNSLNTALVTNLTSQGTLKFTAPNSSVSGPATLGGTVLVQGDATNGAGTGVQIARTINPGGAYAAMLDLRQATLATPITNLTLATDAQIHFGTATTTISRFVVAGSPTALVPLDVVSADGNVNVTGDGTGAANQVVISQAEFAGGHVVDFTVSATDGRATLRQAITVDAGTTLRNDAAMTIGGSGTVAATVGATTAAAGSSFINGAAGQLTLLPGAAISVAAIQNAGAITAAGSATFAAPLTNTGTIDVTGGTLTLAAATQGAGTITVENGAALAVGAALAEASLTLNAAARLTLTSGAAITAAIQNAGAITAAGSATLMTPLTNTGTIDVTAGTLTLGGATQGAGTITVESGAALTVGAALAQTSVTLNGAAQLTLTQPTSFNATLQNLTIGAKIDLAGRTVTAASVTNGTLAITTTTGTVTLSETGLVNNTALALASDGAGGTTLTVDPSDLPHPAAYRFFDSIHGTQFLTTSLSETQALQTSRPDLIYEGIGIGAANPTIDTAAAPVYRFFDSVFGTHFYTSSATERATVIATRPDLINEGIGFYEHTTAQPGDVAVYRYFDNTVGTHFYTSSATERATIATTRPDLISEGISFYSPTNPTA